MSAARRVSKAQVQWWMICFIAAAIIKIVALFKTLQGVSSLQWVKTFFMASNRLELVTPTLTIQTGALSSVLRPDHQVLKSR